MTSRKCQEWERDLIERISGAAPQLADSEMLQHAAECQDCGELLWVHLRLTSAEPEIPIPNQIQFDHMRAEVLRRVGPGPEALASRAARSSSGSLKSLISDLFLNPLFAYSLLILMVFSTAIFSGSMSSSPADWSSLLESEIGRLATKGAGLQESANSPYILSNLSIRPLAEDHVSMAFDVTTHLELVRPQDDPLVREALAQSLISPSTLGAKLKAIAFAEDLPSPKLREGLVYAALHDQNPIVRMSALGVLTQAEDDPLVQRACLEILSGDDSVQMRLIAIDYLGRSPDVLRRAIDQNWSQDPALRIRAATYLQ